MLDPHRYKGGLTRNMYSEVVMTVYVLSGLVYKFKLLISY